MKRTVIISLLLFTICFTVAGQDSLRISGQVSSWININTENKLPLWGGLRYIPQLNYSRSDAKGKLFDTELSANIYGSAGLHPFDSLAGSGRIKPYRAWVRYSTDQFELRLGIAETQFRFCYDASTVNVVRSA